MIEKHRMRMLIRLLIPCYLCLSLYSSYVPCFLLMIGCLPYLWTSLAEGCAYHGYQSLPDIISLGLSAEGRKISAILGH
jgi:hypothetical protein